MDDEVVTMVRNFRSGNGWEAVVLKLGDVQTIQQNLREFNRAVLEESLKDATKVLTSYAGPHENRTERLCQLAIFLASKRAVDVVTAYEEYLRAKIWTVRNGNSASENH